MSDDYSKKIDEMIGISAYDELKINDTEINKKNEETERNLKQLNDIVSGEDGF